MRRGGQRGHAAVWVLGALAVSTGVGIAAYAAIKDWRASHAGDEVATTTPSPPPPPSKPAPPPEPAPEPDPAPAAAPRMPPPELPTPVDKAQAAARDPELDGAPGVVLGTPGAEGTVDMRAVMASLGASTARLARCHDTDGGGERAIVRVTLVLNRRGGVIKADPNGNTPLDTCVTDLLKELRYGRAEDYALLVVPIGFIPSADAPPVAPGTPPSLTREDIQTALDVIRPKVVACGTAAGATGLVKVRFHVLPSGMVNEVTVGEGAAPELAACMVRAFKSYTFPASQAGVRASVPFSF